MTGDDRLSWSLVCLLMILPHRPRAAPACASPPTAAMQQLGGAALPTLTPTQVVVASFQSPQTQTREHDTEYVLHCVHSCDGTSLAAHLSNQQIKLFDRSTLAAKGTLEGHQAPITDLSASPDVPHLLLSSSEDKSLRLWDCRVGGSAPVVAAQEDAALCCSFGLGSTLVAAGLGVPDAEPGKVTNRDKVVFFDIRGGFRKLGQYGDVHTDLINKVVFHPSSPTLLATGSEDGLVCIYDVGVGKAEEALVCIMQSENTVRDVVFFGPQHEGLSILTGSETMSVWHWPTARRVVDFGDLREYSRGWGQAMEYGVGCYYDAPTDSLVLAGGDHDGNMVLSKVHPDRLEPFVTMRQGHQSMVRVVDHMGGSPWMVTGGEDARLCIWPCHPQQQGKGQTAPPEPPSASSSSHVRQKVVRPPSYKPY